MQYFIKSLSKNRFKRIISKFLTYFLDFDTIELALQKNQIQKSLLQVTIENDSRFYSETRVYNLQNDPSKIKIHNNSHIRGELFIWPYGDGIEIGSNSFVGKNSFIWAGEKIKIGNGVLISHNVTIIDSNSHDFNFIEREKHFVEMIKYGHSSQKGRVKTSPITIEDNVWISYNVCILKGVNIGKGAIIGAGSVVTKDVMPFTLVAGNPAILIREIPLNERE